MAQEFFVSSATRTHATEAGSGAASMMIAIYMKSKGIKTLWQLVGCQQCWQELQSNIRQIMPLEWTINGKKYPDSLDK